MSLMYIHVHDTVRTVRVCGLLYRCHTYLEPLRVRLKLERILLYTDSVILTFLLLLT
jgi:hypothetical protein